MIEILENKSDYRRRGETIRIKFLLSFLRAKLIFQSINDVLENKSVQLKLDKLIEKEINCTINIVTSLLIIIIFL